MSADENRTPLDADEQALARRYRGLPGDEPPPALDARIRAQARSAALAGRPKLRPWAWGLSTAAAAVLALAMLWQTGLPPTTEDSAYRTVPGVPPKAVDPLLRDQADATGEDRARPRAIAPAAEVAAPAPAQAPPSAQSSVPERVPSPERGAANRKALAPPATETTAVAERTIAAQPRLEAATDATEPASSTAELARAASADALHENPEAWLRHIVQLLADARRDEALEQLHAFRKTHPEHALPQPLQALLDSETR